METIKLVVFDMAGTTVQDKKEVETCFANACENTGLEVSEERILALQGYSKKEVFRMLWEEKIGKSHPEYAENVEVSYDYFCMILEEHYQTSEVLPTDGCLELFAFLRQNNIKIALTTGFYRKVSNIILKKLGWLDGLEFNYVNTANQSIIDVSVTSDEVQKGRPEPFMIQKAMHLMGIKDPKNVINIGDTPSDIASGKKADCLYSVGITNGTHSKEQLALCENDRLVENLSEFKEFLQAIIQNKKTPVTF